MRVIHRMRRCRSGATAIEFAITSLAFIMLSAGIYECGRGLFLRNHLGHATDVAVRKMLVAPTATNQQIDSTLRAALKMGDPDLLVIEFFTEAVGSTTRRRLLVRYPIALGIPGRPVGTVTLEVERLVPTT